MVESRPSAERPQWVETEVEDAFRRCQQGSMRAYVLTSGLIFFALALAHAARLVQEGAAPLGEPIFVVTTLLAFAMTIWAFLIWRR